jgi:hypothetical protein
MAPDPKLRPPGMSLGDLRKSIIKAYTESQRFLGFALQQQKGLIKIDAAFKLDAAQEHINGLAESEDQIRRAADNCEKYCSLADRTSTTAILQLVADFPHVVQHQLCVSNVR